MAPILWVVDLGRCVDGVNADADRLRREDLPHEFHALDIERGRWTPQGSITLGRASGLDVNWATLPRLFQAADPALRRRALERVIAVAEVGGASFEAAAGGGALIGNDPHLGFMLPNPWVIAGLRSPSDRIVGMSAPGTPVFAFGRTERLAWGGPNCGRG